MKNRRPLFLGTVVLAVVVVASAAPGCYGATEISVAVTTTIACTPSIGLTTQIFAGPTGTTDFGTAPAAESVECGATEPRVGTLSIVPGGARDGQFDLEVVGAVGVSPADCRDASLGRGAAAPGVAVPSTPTGCVVVRRRVSFRPHKSLTVPVLLSAKCIGVACGSDETCDLGVCTKAVECTDQGCPRERGEVVVDAGPDAVVAADVFVPDAPVDAADAPDAAAPPRCTTTPEVVIDAQNIRGQLSIDGDDLVYVNRIAVTSEVRRVPRGGVALAPGLRKIPVPGLTAVTTGPTGIAWAAYSTSAQGDSQLLVTTTPPGGMPETSAIAALAGTQSIAFAGSQLVGVMNTANTGFVPFATTGTTIRAAIGSPLPGASSEVLSDTRGHFYGVASTETGTKSTLFHAAGSGAAPTYVWRTSATFMEADIALANDTIYFVVPTQDPTNPVSPGVGIHRLPVDAIPPDAYDGTPWSTAVVPSSMAADQTTLYQLAHDVIYTTPLSAISPTAMTLTPTGALARGLQVDDRCVYWIEGDSTIVRRSKQ